MNPVEVPGIERLSCRNCSLPLRFILQLYAPLEDKKECFHRTLFLFCCENIDCLFHEGSIKVLRCQLPRENAFYSSEPPLPASINDTEVDDEIEEIDTSRGNDADEEIYEHWIPEKGSNDVKLCELCGMKASKICSKCHSVAYCGKIHQKRHWYDGHKMQCCNSETTDEERFSSIRDLLFPQYEIVIEDEDPKFIEDFAKNHVEEEKKLFKKYSRNVKTLDANEKQELNEFEWENDVELDPVLEEFQNHIRAYSSQCVRYNRGLDLDQVLWMSKDFQCTKNDIPFCSYCGGNMVFEFQVMPQTLHYLSVDGWRGSRKVSMDWGVLAVFTCKESCNNGLEAYKEEFVWFHKNPGSL